MAHEETQKKVLVQEESQKKQHDMAHEERKKTRIAHEEINKTRDVRCMRKFQKPGFSGAKNYGINGAFPYEIAEKTRFSKRTRIEAPFGAWWIWIFFLCQYRGCRKQAKKARRLDKKSARLEIVVRDVAPPGLLRTFSSSLGYQKCWNWAAGLCQNSWAKHQSETHNSWLWQVHDWICIYENIWICS